MRLLFVHDPLTSHRYIPRLRARVAHEDGGYLVRTNSAGFRCEREVTEAKPPDGRRLLLFGDSFTAGDGVSNRYRYGDLLEQAVPGLEVLNFAVPGTGTDEQYLTWRRYGREIEADLLVIALNIDHVERVMTRTREWASPEGVGRALEKPYFTLGPSEDLLLHNVPCSPLPLRMRALGAPAGQPATAAGPTGPGPLAEYEDPAHPAWRLLRAVVARWAGESSVPVLVFLLPTPDFVEGRADPTAYRQRFSELAQDLGVPVVDALETVHELVPSFLRRELRFPLDHHPSKFAHQVLAASLAKAVAPLLDRDPATCQ